MCLVYMCVCMCVVCGYVCGVCGVWCACVCVVCVSVCGKYMLCVYVYVVCVVCVVCACECVWQRRVGERREARDLHTAPGIRVCKKGEEHVRTGGRNVRRVRCPRNSGRKEPVRAGQGSLCCDPPSTSVPKSSPASPIGPQVSGPASLTQASPLPKESGEGQGLQGPCLGGWGRGMSRKDIR